MRAPALWTAHLILLAGCATGPAVTERTVAAPPAVVLERIGAELDALGFTRSGGQPGALAASSDRALPAWATCSPALVGDGDDRRVMVSAERRYAEVRVTAAPAGGQAAVVHRCGVPRRLPQPAAGGELRSAAAGPRAPWRRCCSPPRAADARRLFGPAGVTFRNPETQRPLSEWGPRRCGPPGSAYGCSRALSPWPRARPVPPGRRSRRRCCRSPPASRSAAAVAAPRCAGHSLPAPAWRPSRRVPTSSARSASGP